METRAQDNRPIGKAGEKYCAATVWGRGPNDLGLEEAFLDLQCTPKGRMETAVESKPQ